MSDYTFGSGDQINCPECPTSGRYKYQLMCVESNYSGCSVDIGQCEECGKAWQISFKVDKITRVEEWDGESREQREAWEASEKQKRIEAEKAKLKELKDKYEKS